MKFSLTFSDATAADLLNVAHFLNGVAQPQPQHQPTITVQHQPQPPVADAEEGPADVNAPVADGAGLPWDERIHSKTKALNADGTWRKRRGVSDALVTTVETELRARIPAPQMQQPQFTPPQMPQPANNGLVPGQTFIPPLQPVNNGIPPFLDRTQPPAPQPQFAPPPMPQPQFTPPPVPQPVQQQALPQYDFGQFMMHLTAQMQKKDANGNGIIDANYCASITQELSRHFNRQFTNITDVSNDQQAIDAAVWFINRDGRWLTP